MDISRFKYFEGIKQLTDQQIILLVSASRILKLKDGEQLPDTEQSEGFQYYLLAGEVKFSKKGVADGPSKTIKAGRKDALGAVTFKHLQKYDFTAVNKAAVIKIEAAQLQGLLTQAPVDDYHVSDELRENQSEEKQLFFDIYADLRNNKLALPSLPKVAMNIRKMIADENCNNKKIGDAVNSDPAIAAKLIRAANSAMYRGAKEIIGSAGAITRLGLQTTQQLVTSFSMKEVFKAKNKIIQKKMDEVWSNSIEIASISSILAKHIPGMIPEQGLLAGLLHNIGKVPVLMYAENYPSLIENEKLLDKAVNELAPELGATIMKRWGFSEDLIEVARFSHMLQRYHQGEADYCDLVIVAQLHASIGTKDHMNPEEAPAFKILSEYSELSPEKSLNILTEAKSQIDETRMMLAA